MAENLQDRVNESSRKRKILKISGWTLLEGIAAAGIIGVSVTVYSFDRMNRERESYEKTCSAIYQNGIKAAVEIVKEILKDPEKAQESDRINVDYSKEN